MNYKRLSWLLLTIIVIIASDFVTKWYVHNHFYPGYSIPVINDFFHLTYVRNSGAAFGMLARSSDLFRIPLFFALPVLICGWLCYLIYKSHHKNLLLAVAYALILAGAVGNLIDRFSKNYVVDFFDFFWGQNHFPAFNIADSSITIAATLLIIDFIFISRTGKNEPSQQGK